MHHGNSDAESNRTFPVGLMVLDSTAILVIHSKSVVNHKGFGVDEDNCFRYIRGAAKIKIGLWKRFIESLASN